MLVTAFLLGLLYVTFTAVLIVLIKSAVLAIVVAGGLLFAQYWFSDRIALYAMNGARRHRGPGARTARSH